MGSQINNNGTASYKVFHRYPESRSNYTFKTGITGENLREIFEEYGYTTKEHLLNEPGADIVIDDCSTGIEVWNFREPHSYEERIDSVIKNLGPFDNRFLIASFISPETREKVENFYVRRPISVIELGFQILPKEYQSFYESHKDLEDKKFCSERTKKVIENRISPILKTLDKITFNKKLIEHANNVYLVNDMLVYDYVGPGKSMELNRMVKEHEKNRGTINLLYVDEGYVYSTNNNNSNRPSPKCKEEKSTVLIPSSTKISGSRTDLTYKTENNEALAVHSRIGNCYSSYLSTNNNSLNKLSKQQKAIMNLLERHRIRWRPCEIAGELYGYPLTPSHRISIARSLKELVKRHLVNEGWKREIRYNDHSEPIYQDFNKWCYWIGETE
jgi:hypothetical protein